MKVLFKSFEMMNLLLNKNVPIGGAAIEYYAWLKGFHNNGCKVGILTWKGANSALIEKEFNYDLVESYDIKKGVPKVRLITSRIPGLLRSIKTYNPDFIFQGCATHDTGILAFVAKMLDKPYIHRIGSDMDVDGRIGRTFTKFSLAIYNYGIKNASHISCQNKYQLEILKKKYPQKSISILYNPYEIKNSLNKKMKKEYIAWVGNFRYEKNLPALADIAKKLPQYKFKIAGTKFNNTDKDSTLGLKDLEGLDNVEFVGHIKNSEITEFLNKAYCLLNTSRLEGFSNTFLEAWSVGVPVITTTNVNPDNLILDFNLGIVAENYEQIQKIIDELILQRQYIDYRERCINYVKENHDPRKLAARFLQEMKNCTNKNLI